jgi:hypothetical protein
MLRRPVSGTKRPRHWVLTPPRSGSQDSRKLVSERVVEEVVKASLENADLDRADAKEIKLRIGNHSGGAAEVLRAA